MLSNEHMSWLEAAKIIEIGLYILFSLCYKELAAQLPTAIDGVR